MPSDAAKKRQAQKREKKQASSRYAQKKANGGPEKANGGPETVQAPNGGEASASSSSPSVSGTSSSLAESVAGMKLTSVASTARSCTGKVNVVHPFKTTVNGTGCGLYP